MFDKIIFSKQSPDDAQKTPKQGWTPHWALSALYKVWQVIFTIVKVAAGAVLTVMIIGAVCALAFANTLGDYLQEEIIPNSDMIIGAVEQDRPSYIYYTDKNGEIQILQRIYASTSWEKAEYEDIPEYLINAAIAI